jgi:hypothetical protein
MVGLAYGLESIVVDLITYIRTLLVSVALTWYATLRVGLRELSIYHPTDLHPGSDTGHGR